VKRNPQAGVRRNAALRLEVFSDADLDDIHRGTLEVLDRTGVFVESDEALDVLADGGCRVERDTRSVRIPPHIVEDAIRSAPSSVRLCGRVPENDVVLEGGRVGFTNFSAGIMVVDPRTDEYRTSTTQDVADLARMTDYLDAIDTYEHAVEGRDGPETTLAIRDAAIALKNTTKCVGTGAMSTSDVDAIVRMGAAVAGGEDKLRERPLVYFCECPVSPLKITRDAAEVIMGAARHGIPNNVISMAMSGASSPVTLAGTLVTHNCEVLASITLAQLTERGAPSIYGSSTTAIDLRLAAASVGSPELSLLSAGVAQLAQRYLLPSFVAGL
jgi:trimethylamine---corrinoid protein Co-methyltransferase